MAGPDQRGQDSLFHISKRPDPFDLSGLVLDERKGISYPDGFQAPDGTLYISYDRNRSTDGEILLARFTEPDIRAGTLVSATSKLKMLICRPLAKDAAKRTGQ